LGKLETICGRSSSLRPGGLPGSGPHRRSSRGPSARDEITYPARLRRDRSNSVHDHTPELWRVSRVDALPRCARRARVMFAGVGKIGCRRCLRVRYRSQCADAKDRAHLAIAKIERRLITRRGRFYKPKGMLWRTFHRLCDRHDHHDAVLNAGLLRAVQRLGRRFGPV
jgi:hypothetical protein